MNLPNEYAIWTVIIVIPAINTVVQRLSNRAMDAIEKKLTAYKPSIHRSLLRHQRPILGGMDLITAALLGGFAWHCAVAPTAPRQSFFVSLLMILAFWHLQEGLRKLVRPK